MSDNNCYGYRPCHFPDTHSLTPAYRVPEPARLAGESHV